MICILPQPSVSKFPGFCFVLNPGEQRGSTFLCAALVQVSMLCPLALLLSVVLNSKLVQPEVHPVNI